MPDFNQIGNPRWMDAVQKALQVQGPTPANVVGPELIPVALALPPLPEHHILRLDRLAIGGLSGGAGGAATFRRVSLFNPADSGVLIIVDRITLSAGSATQVSIRQGTGTAGEVLQGNVTGFRDGRLPWGGTRFPVGRIYSLADATTSGIEVGVLRVPALTSYPVEESFILSPNSRLTIQERAGNIAIDVLYYWREHIPTQQELSPVS